MVTYASEARIAFYDEVWQLAIRGGSNHWCRTTTEHNCPSGSDALVARDYDSRHLRSLWPVEGTDQEGRPCWVPTSEKIERAFTEILRTNAPAVTLPDPQVRRRLHLAEQHVNAAELTPELADLVLQVAVFGQVVFT